MPGSGLGLSIVHQVAERHAGTVEAGRSAGGGARLTLQPARLAHCPATPSRSPVTTRSIRASQPHSAPWSRRAQLLSGSVPRRPRRADAHDSARSERTPSRRDPSTPATA